MKIVEESGVKLINNNNEFNTKRNYGIDLLKMIAMINIIILHINREVFLLHIKPSNPVYRHVYKLQIFSFWPVDTFGLISGFIGFKKYKFSNLIYLWFEYFYYSIIFSIYLYTKSLIDLKNLILSFFPLGIKRFWYINAYFFMYLLLPFITNSINFINKNIFNKLIIWSFFIYSFYHTIFEYYTRITNFDYIANGYSSIWLINLYIAGGYIGRFYHNKLLISNIIPLIIYLFSSFVTYEYTFYTIKKHKYANTILIRHYSPTIIIQAVSLILFFSNLKISNKYIKRAILFFIPLNFSVVLIHLRIFSFKTKTVLKFFKYVSLLNPQYFFFKIYGISIIIYFLCAFFDYFRFLLFKLFKIRFLSEFIAKKLF